MLEVRRVMEQEQREVSLRLQQKQGFFSQATERLQELLRYREDYLQRFQCDAGGGLAGTRLRNYQAFLAKLDNAIRQQQDILARARAEADFEREKLRDVSGQMAAVSGVAARWSGEERRADDRAEQRHSDELGERAFVNRHSKTIS